MRFCCGEIFFNFPFSSRREEIFRFSFFPFRSTKMWEVDEEYFIRHFFAAAAFEANVQGKFGVVGRKILRAKAVNNASLPFYYFHFFLVPFLLKHSKRIIFSLLCVLLHDEEYLLLKKWQILPSLPFSRFLLLCRIEAISRRTMGRNLEEAKGLMAFWCCLRVGLPSFSSWVENLWGLWFLSLLSGMAKKKLRRTKKKA